MSPCLVKQALNAGALNGFKSGRNWKVIEADLTRYTGAKEAATVNPVVEASALLIGVTITLEINGVQVPARIAGVTIPTKTGK